MIPHLYHKHHRLVTINNHSNKPTIPSPLHHQQQHHNTSTNAPNKPTTPIVCCCPVLLALLLLLLLLLSPIGPSLGIGSSNKSTNNNNISNNSLSLSSNININTTINSITPLSTIMIIPSMATSLTTTSPLTRAKIFHDWYSDDDDEKDEHLHISETNITTPTPLKNVIMKSKQQLQLSSSPKEKIKEVLCGFEQQQLAKNTSSSLSIIEATKIHAESNCTMVQKPEFEKLRSFSSQFQNHYHQSNLINSTNNQFNELNFTNKFISPQTGNGKPGYCT